MEHYKQALLLEGFHPSFIERLENKMMQLTKQVERVTNYSVAEEINPAFIPNPYHLLLVNSSNQIDQGEVAFVDNIMKEIGTGVEPYLKVRPN